MLDKMPIWKMKFLAVQAASQAIQPAGQSYPRLRLQQAQMTSQTVSLGSPNSRKNSKAAKEGHVDSHAVTKRLQSELMSLMASSDKGISAFPDGDSLFSWIGTIEGAPGTVFEGLSFKLSLKFPSDYPYKAPNVKFESACFHPNVDVYGNICLDILKDKWSAAYSVRTVLLSIQSLLGEPNNDSPLNTTAAKMWSNQPEFRAYLLSKQQDGQ